MIISIYRTQNGLITEETTTPPYQGATPYRTIDTDEVAAAALLAQKQELLAKIEPLQMDVLRKWDAWASKSWGAELKNKATKQEIKAKAEIADTWADEIRAQNDDISTANTIAEIQARIDEIKALDALFPYLTQAEYDADAGGFR